MQFKQLVLQKDRRIQYGLGTDRRFCFGGCSDNRDGDYCKKKYEP